MSGGLDRGVPLLARARWLPNLFGGREGSNDCGAWNAITHWPLLSQPPRARDVVDFWISTTSRQDGHSVESVGMRRLPMARQPGARYTLDLTPLQGRDRMEGMAEALTGAGLDLDEGDDIVSRYDQVYLAVPEAVVPGEDRVAGVLEIAGGEVFTVDAERVRSSTHLMAVWVRDLGRWPARLFAAPRPVRRTALA